MSERFTSLDNKVSVSPLIGLQSVFPDVDAEGNVKPHISSACEPIVEAIECGPLTFTVRWSCQAHEELEKYDVFCCSLSEGLCLKYRMEKRQSLTVKGLTPFSSFLVRIKAQLKCQSLERAGSDLDCFSCPVLICSTLQSASFSPFVSDLGKLGFEVQKPGFIDCSRYSLGSIKKLVGFVDVFLDSSIHNEEIPEESDKLTISHTNIPNEEEEEIFLMNQSLGKNVGGPLSSTSPVLCPITESGSNKNMVPPLTADSLYVNQKQQQQQQHREDSSKEISVATFSKKENYNNTNNNDDDKNMNEDDDDKNTYKNTEVESPLVKALPSSFVNKASNAITMNADISSGEAFDAMKNQKKDDLDDGNSLEQTLQQLPKPSLPRKDTFPAFDIPLPARASTETRAVLKPPSMDMILARHPSVATVDESTLNLMKNDLPNIASTRSGIRGTSPYVKSVEDKMRELSASSRRTMERSDSVATVDGVMGMGRTHTLSSRTMRRTVTLLNDDNEDEDEKFGDDVLRVDDDDEFFKSMSLGQRRTTTLPSNSKKMSDFSEFINEDDESIVTVDDKSDSIIDVSVTGAIKELPNKKEENEEGEDDSFQKQMDEYLRSRHMKEPARMNQDAEIKTTLPLSHDGGIENRFPNHSHNHTIGSVLPNHGTTSTMIHPTIHRDPHHQKQQQPQREHVHQQLHRPFSMDETVAQLQQVTHAQRAQQQNPAQHFAQQPPHQHPVMGIGNAAAKAHHVHYDHIPSPQPQQPHPQQHPGLSQAASLLLRRLESGIDFDPNRMGMDDLEREVGNEIQQLRLAMPSLRHDSQAMHIAQLRLQQVLTCEERLRYSRVTAANILNDMNGGIVAKKWIPKKKPNGETVEVKREDEDLTTEEIIARYRPGFIVTLDEPVLSSFRPNNMRQRPKYKCEVCRWYATCDKEWIEHCSGRKHTIRCQMFVGKCNSVGIIIPDNIRNLLATSTTTECFNDPVEKYIAQATGRDVW